MTDKLVATLALAVLNSHYRANGLEEQTELGAFDGQYFRDAKVSVSVFADWLRAVGPNSQIGAWISSLADMLEEEGKP